MRERLEAVVEELKRRRAEGETSVFVAEGTLEALRAACAAASEAGAGGAAAGEAAKEIGPTFAQELPERIRSATPEDFEKALAGAPSPSREKTPSAESAARRLPEPPVVSLPEGSKRERWEALRETVLSCPVCRARTPPGMKVVFGVGNIDADLFFCGEAPGADEERRGEPFVGRAGQLLDKMIRAMGLERGSVYIANIMNWRPDPPSRTGNRPPTAEEMAFCLPYLRAQVEVVQPKAIVALGATATKGLLGAAGEGRMRDIKGRWDEFGGVPVMPTYHPSYLLRNSGRRDKRSAWEDLLKAMDRVGLPVSERQRNFFLV